MRRYGILLGCAAVAVLLFAVGTEAQFRGGKGNLAVPSLGGGIGGFGSGGNNPVMLLFRADVKKELELTSEQLDKVHDAVMKALAEVLDDKQMKRFRQIDLQVRDTNAFTDAQLQKDLKTTESQVKSIQQILDDSAREAKEIFTDARGGNLMGLQQKMDGLRLETRERVMGVLTSAQRKAYKQMLGEEFKMKQGRGPGKKKDS
jgi:hypothetical protein